MKWNDPVNFWRFKLRIAMAFAKDCAFQAGLKKDQSLIAFWNIEAAALNEEIEALVVERQTQGT